MSYQSSYVAITIRHAEHVSNCTLVTMIPTTTLLALHYTFIAQILVATTCLLKLLYDTYMYFIPAPPYNVGYYLT
jgi:hypothetical protein